MMKNFLIGVILFIAICTFADTAPYKICPKCGNVYQLEYKYCPVDGELLLQIGGYPSQTPGKETATPAPSESPKSSITPVNTVAQTPNPSVTPSSHSTPTPVILKSESGEELKFYPIDFSDKTGSCPENMVFIAAGSFNMGSKIFPYPKDAKLIHSVFLDSYCIDKYEYPNKLFSIPTSNVNYNESSQKCSDIGKRLCTEAEWEKACKGIQFYEYPYGKRYDIMACRIDKDRMDGPVVSGEMSRCASHYGVFDMSGNLAEWVSDYYDENYYYTSPNSNPKGPETGEMRIIRGGSFQDFGMRTKCAYREDKKPERSSVRIGFRCCKNSN
ncbi:SUMF1/EgtB/PvdO family nonheme iron enzyme [bacterium]|nr:SUMF1/EgtB/PvdO family nonheme iron enzyme [bacterium]